MATNPTHGTYSASILGTISSHLEGLQGFGPMCLELIQNADDAKATSIVFDITDDALLVQNNSTFSERDFVRITEVASAGKSADNELIGRFGIGFVSTYQVTDQPQIISSGKKLTLIPQEERFTHEDVGVTEGTLVRLNWATDSASSTRLALKQSAVTPSDFDKMQEDILAVLHQGVLFLRNLSQIELRRNGEVVEACNFERSSAKHLSVHFNSDGSVQDWVILTGDIETRAESLLAKFPQLSMHRRNTLISLAFRVNTDVFRNGYFYAYLPTEQLVGLPFHINGDFFTEPDRKSIIFAGNKHQQAWNELIVRSAAILFARNLETLRDVLGPGRLWETISKAAVLRDRARNQSIASVFGAFWHAIFERFKSQPAVIWNAKDAWSKPEYCFFSQAKFTEQELEILSALGLDIVADDLRPFQKVLMTLGVEVLGLSQIMKSIANNPEFLGVCVGDQLDTTEIDSKYVPLWSLLDKVFGLKPLFNTIPNSFFQLPLFVRADGAVDCFESIVRLPPGYTSEKLLAIIPDLALCHPKISAFESLSSKISVFGFSSLVKLLSEQVTSERAAIDYLGTESDRLFAFYNLLSELYEDAGKSRVAQARMLRELPILRGPEGFIDSGNATMQGDFHVSFGSKSILDTALLSDSARSFVSNILEVPELTLEVFIKDYLPGLFEGEVNLLEYQQLLSELIKNSALQLDVESVTILRDKFLLPVGADQWNKAKNLMLWNDEFEGALNPEDVMFVNMARLDPHPELGSFLEGLGVATRPSAALLVDRMAEIAGSCFAVDGRDDAEKVCRVIARYFNEWQAENSADFQMLAKLKSMSCFPSSGPDSNWHKPTDLVITDSGENLAGNEFYFTQGDDFNLNFLNYLGVQTITIVEKAPVTVASDSPLPVPELQRLKALLEKIKLDPESLSISDQRDLDLILANISTELRVGQRSSMEDMDQFVEHPWFSNISDGWCKPSDCIVNDVQPVAELFGEPLCEHLIDDHFELREIYAALGIPKLSSVISRNVSNVVHPTDQDLIGSRFTNRAMLLAKILEDLYSGSADQLVGLFENITVQSCESLQLSVSLEAICFSALCEIETAVVGYDQSTNHLYVQEPLDYSMWPRVFRGLLHVVLPGVTGNELRNRILGCSAVMASTRIKDASGWMMDAGFEAIDVGITSVDVELGSDDSVVDVLALPNDGRTQESSVDEVFDHASIEEIELSEFEDVSEELIVLDDDEEPKASNVVQLDVTDNKKTSSVPDEKESTLCQITVCPDSVGEQVAEFESDLQKAGRFAVVSYERERARHPEPHASEAKGWDITSATTGGSMRYIKVIAIEGEWIGSPVVITQLAYQTAVEKAGSYWLYVVEIVKGKTPRVLAIPDPANKAQSFRFDETWRMVAEPEKISRTNADDSEQKSATKEKSDVTSGSILSSFKGLFK